MYNCPKCNFPFEPGTKFCSNCGCNLENSYTITHICPTCYRTYPAGTTYCPDDGSKLVSSLKYATKENTDTNTKIHHKKAPLGSRFVAYLLDNLITMVLAIPFGIFLYLMSTSHKEEFLVLALISLIPCLIYSFIKDGLGEGQSWGKKIMGLKVIKVSDNSNCSKGTSALRYLIYVLVSTLGKSLAVVSLDTLGGKAVVYLGTLGSNLAPFFLAYVFLIVETIMIIAQPDGRRLADLAVGTMVISVKQDS